MLPIWRKLGGFPRAAQGAGTNVRGGRAPMSDTDIGPEFSGKFRAARGQWPARNFSASSAAMQPMPALVTAWR
jgi:hypothetical protein